MSDMVKVRIKSNGPEYWRLIVEDAETGKMLPVIVDEHSGIHLDIQNGDIVARVALMVTEIDVECAAEMTETIESIRKVGGIVRVVEAPIVGHTPDGIALRCSSGSLADV